MTIEYTVELPTQTPGAEWKYGYGDMFLVVSGPCEGDIVMLVQTGNGKHIIDLDTGNYFHTAQLEGWAFTLDQLNAAVSNATLAPAPVGTRITKEVKAH